MHSSGRPLNRIVFGPFSLDPDTGELRKGPTRLKVPDQSVEVLKALLERPGALVTREDLRDRLWKADTFVDFESGLNGAVRRLREALGDSADRPKYVETLPRRGYRFIGTIEADPVIARISPSPHAAQPPSGVDPDPTLPGQQPATERSSPHHRRLTWRYLPIAGLVVLLGVLTLRAGRGTPWEAAVARSTPITSFPGTEVDPVLSPAGNQIAFAWDRDTGDNLDIYVQLLDGAEPVQLTSNPAAERAPAWSSDGGRIAFLRASITGSDVIIVPATGGPEQRVTETHVAPNNGQYRSNGLTWTPDDAAVLLVDRTTSGDTAIFLCSIATGERRQLTGLPHDAHDTWPALSPDGKYLGFVRRRSGQNLGSVFLQPLRGLQPVGDPHQLTSDRGTGALAWTHDNASIVYETGAGLWRVPVTGGQPQPVLTSVRATAPSIARDGSRLVFQNTTTDTNIWKVPGPEATEGSREAPQRVIGSTLTDQSPQFSPSGDSIAFVSVRSGTSEIYASRSDGSNPTRLTAFGGPLVGSPRWSPDEKSIAFDSVESGSFNIHVVGTEDRRVRSITEGPSANVRPSWSRDGRWIYFGSNRSGAFEVWKVPAAGGTAIPITHKGGYEAFDSPDGKDLYYAKPPGTEGIWRVPVGGGDEAKVIDYGRQSSWTVTEHGIALLTHWTDSPRVEFFSFALGRFVSPRDLPDGLQLAPFVAPQFSVSRDGRWMLYVNYDNWGSDIHALRGPW